MQNVLLLTYATYYLAIQNILLVTRLLINQFCIYLYSQYTELLKIFSELRFEA